MKKKTIYTCQNCGAESPKWLGRCPDCDQWNTYAEETIATPIATSNRTAFLDLKSSPPKLLEEVNAEEAEHIPTKISEFDRVLGGGYVPGSAILVGGDPGIGKSTLLLQTLCHLGEQNKKVLYISGEESAAQIKARAKRLSLNTQNVWIVTENILEQILEVLKTEKPDLIVVDSIQTLFSTQWNSAPGTVTQVRESAAGLISWVKTNGAACFLIGHVTKEGSLAGPKVLEHMVDVVLYFTSDQGHTFRILRGFKNRYGPTHEIGVFEMTAEGLKTIANPSQFFLSERSQRTIGSVISTSVEGSRPLLLEIQALVTHSGFPNPRRTTLGVDASRVALLVAVLEKIVGFSLSDQDIFVNIAGGLKITEPALDLAIAVAIASSFKNVAIDPKTIFIGELGLTGEIRGVTHIEKRLKEASKLGFTKALIPHTNAKQPLHVEGLETQALTNIEEALSILF